MIWFALSILFSLTVGTVVATKADYDKVFEFFMSTGVSLLLSGLLSLISAIGVGAFAYDKDYYSYTFDIMAAKDGSSINGHFGIFGGFIDEEPYYFFYRRYSDGRIEQGKIRANSTVIYQDQESNDQAFIKVTKTHTGIRLWGFPPGDDPRYEIHVSDGSVVQDIKFDLE